MEKLIVFVLYWFSYILFALLDAVLGWWILDEFGLSFGTWVGIVIVAMAIIRSASILSRIFEGLTNASKPAKL